MIRHFLSIAVITEVEISFGESKCLYIYIYIYIIVKYMAPASRQLEGNSCNTAKCCIGKIAACYLHHKTYYQKFVCIMGSEEIKVAFGSLL